MARRSVERWLELQQIGAATVVRFVPSEIFDEEAIDLVGKQLRHLVECCGCRQLVLDFGAVQRMSTHLVGELIGLHEKMHGVQGRLVFCEFKPELRQTFESLQLNQIFTICDTQDAALQGR